MRPGGPSRRDAQGNAQFSFCPLVGFITVEAPIRPRGIDGIGELPEVHIRDYQVGGDVCIPARRHAKRTAALALARGREGTDAVEHRFKPVFPGLKVVASLQVDPEPFGGCPVRRATAIGP